MRPPYFPAFEIAINHLDGKWTIQPSVQGLLQVIHLSDVPIDIPCLDNYFNGKLFARAKWSQLQIYLAFRDSSWIILSLILSLVKHNVLNLNASFSSGNHHYQLGGSISSTNPLVAITAPSSGDTLSGNVTVCANASDDTGVTSCVRCWWQ
jgi:hypothetical protein